MDSYGFLQVRAPVLHVLLVSDAQQSRSVTHKAFEVPSTITGDTSETGVVMMKRNLLTARRGSFIQRKMSRMFGI